MSLLPPNRNAIRALVPVWDAVERILNQVVYGNYKMEVGASSVSFAGAGTAVASVGHSLGKTPIFAAAMAELSTGEALFCAVQAKDSNSIDFEFRTDDATVVTITRDFTWIAVVER